MMGHIDRGNHNAIWLTPPEFISILGPFDLDPCAAPSPRPWPTSRRHIELPENGLQCEWFGRVWLNPPFESEIRPLFMEKMAEHQNGIMLIPAAVETAAFEKFVWKRASSILFLNKRPNFHFPDGRKSTKNSGAPMCLVGYGQFNDAMLSFSRLGRYIDKWY